MIDSRRVGVAAAACVGVAVVVGLVLALGSGIGLAAPGNSGNSNSKAEPPPKALSVNQTGSTHVAPGVTGSITVEIRNPNNQPVVLTEVTGSVTSVTRRPGVSETCSKDWFAVEPWSEPPTAIAAKGVRTVALTTTFNNLADTNQDACKGASFSYTLTATGRQA